MSRVVVVIITRVVDFCRSLPFYLLKPQKVLLLTTTPLSSTFVVVVVVIIIAFVVVVVVFFSFLLPSVCIHHFFLPSPSPSLSVSVKLIMSYLQMLPVFSYFYYNKLVRSMRTFTLENYYYLLAEYEEDDDDDNGNADERRRIRLGGAH